MLTPETDTLTQSQRMMWRFRTLRASQMSKTQQELQKSQDGQRPRFTVRAKKDSMHLPPGLSMLIWWCTLQRFLSVSFAAFA